MASPAASGNVDGVGLKGGGDGGRMACGGMRAADDVVLEGGGGDDGRRACDAVSRERHGSTPEGG